MPASLLRAWMRYYTLEPFGEARADVRAAIIAATVFNMQRGRQPARKVRDFLAVPPSRADATAAHTAALKAFLRKRIGGEHADADEPDR